MDATAALVFAYEPACDMAIFANNMGRMTESLLLWNLNEVGISRLALPYCSYSTIMPQKRNPVALETLRYSGEWTYGTLSSMFNTMKAYPPGNGREPGLVVGQFFEIMKRITDSTFLLEGIIRNQEVDVPRQLALVRNGFNIASMSFDPEGILAAIRKYKPEFEMEYKVEPLKQANSDSWPNSLDDICARQ